MTDSDRETLEFLCWLFASDAQRFWPIEETAKACMDAVEDTYNENPEMDYVEGLAWEQGQHSRMIKEACELFEQLHSRGYDPVRMAEQEIERSRQEGLDLTDIDWSWLRFSALLPDEYVEKHL